MDTTIYEQFSGDSRSGINQNGTFQGGGNEGLLAASGAVAAHGQETSESSLSRPAFKCPECPKEFSENYKLTKHMRNHTRPLKCHICPKGEAQQKGMNRHLWTKHPEYAKANKIPKDKKICPDCTYEGRSDNFKRHVATKH